MGVQCWTEHKRSVSSAVLLPAIFSRFKLWSVTSYCIAGKSYSSCKPGSKGNQQVDCFFFLFFFIQSLRRRRRCYVEAESVYYWLRPFQQRLLPKGKDEAQPSSARRHLDEAVELIRWRISVLYCRHCRVNPEVDLAQRQKSKWEFSAFEHFHSYFDSFVRFNNKLRGLTRWEKI